MKKPTIGKVLRLLLGVVVLSILTGRCKEGNVNPQAKLDQPDLTSDEIKRLVLLDPTNVYDPVLARQDAITIGAELDAEDAAHGIKSHRTLGEVYSFSIPDTIRYPKTDRSDKKDPGAYIFNYVNKEGFAIISGDTRAFGRLGWSGKGTMDKDARISFFMSRAIRYIQAKRQEIESMRGDHIHTSLLNKLVGFKVTKAPDGSNPNDKTAVASCAPIPDAKTQVMACSTSTTSTPVSTSSSLQTVVPYLMQTQWDQISPYNNYYASSSSCSNPLDPCGNTNNHYVTGCTETAESQVIAYFYGKNPTKYGADWATIANTPYACTLNPTQIDKVATLLNSVYNSYYFTFESCAWKSGTFTYPKPDKGMNVSYGINPDSWRSYNNTDLEASLISKSPVPSYGTEDLICACLIWLPIAGCIWDPCLPDPTAYHEWVVDGLQRVNTSITYTVVPVDNCCRTLPSYNVTYTNVTNSYTHNNWGWGGNSNGWYTEGAFGGLNSSGLNNVFSFNHDDHIIAYVTPTN